ncbi:MAG: hypothetical protein JWP97_4016, partial [Labilithrix sp.]|nr:hypothetical protein [Labilithrix sp.]
MSKSKPGETLPFDFGVFAPPPPPAPVRAPAAAAPVAP